MKFIKDILQMSYDYLDHVLNMRAIRVKYLELYKHSPGVAEKFFFGMVSAEMTRIEKKLRIKFESPKDIDKRLDKISENLTTQKESDEIFFGYL